MRGGWVGGVGGRERLLPCGPTGIGAKLHPWHRLYPGQGESQSPARHGQCTINSAASSLRRRAAHGLVADVPSVFPDTCDTEAESAA